MNVAVIGGGYVGLPTAVALATLGHNVVCCERDACRRQKAETGRAPFVDVGLEEALAIVVQSGQLRFCADVADAIENIEIAIVAVPVESGKTGLNELNKVAAIIATKSHCVLVIKSTVPPGTCKKLRQTYGICVASNPEFLRQGHGFEDCISPPRIVVGVDELHARQLLHTLYLPLIERGREYIEISSISAEIAKLTSNTFLAGRIALINETSDLCEVAGGNIKDVARVLAADSRIGSDYLRASVGFGGSCLPKDGRLLVDAGEVAGLDMHAIKAIYLSNQQHIQRVAEQIIAQLPRNATVAIWGVAFKPEVNSICESPAVCVMQILAEYGIRLQVCDPLVDTTSLQNMLPTAMFFKESIAAATHADALVVLNKQQEFLHIAPADIARAMLRNIVFDYTGIFNYTDCQQAGLTLHAVGAFAAMYRAS